MHADLRLKDVPGQLVRALEPISTFGGNINGVVHHHEKVIGGRISVNVTFEVKGQKQLEGMLQAWKERDVDVAKLSSLFETYEFEYVLAGDISPQELHGITEGIEAVHDLDSVELRYSVSPSTGDKAVLVYGKVKQKAALDRVDDLLRQRAMDSGYLLIGGLGE
ncbi:MAG TPA: hypothetical protein VEH08_02360 [Methanomassiliicoccales archaeon]|nr:hypothetical protein [Methanomassiliicoccales archaeon]